MGAVGCISEGTTAASGFLGRDTVAGGISGDEYIAEEGLLGLHKKVHQL